MPSWSALNKWFNFQLTLVVGRQIYYFRIHSQENWIPVNFLCEFIPFRNILSILRKYQKKGVALGLMKGSISLCRYRLVGDNSFSLEKLNNKFRKYQSGLLGEDTQSSKEMRAGWVMPSGLSPEEERYGDYWDLSDCEVDEGYLLRLRIERKKIPSEFFQVMLRQKLDQINLERDKPLGKNARKIVSDELKENLLAKALPTISYIDAYWRTDGLVTLFSTAKKNKEIFEDFFIKTFAKTLGCSLVPLAPPLLGLSIGQWDLSEKTESFLGKVEPLLPGAHLKAGNQTTATQ